MRGAKRGQEPLAWPCPMNPACRFREKSGYQGLIYRRRVPRKDRRKTYAMPIILFTDISQAKTEHLHQ
jgi:hypothetical protein